MIHYFIIGSFLFFSFSVAYGDDNQCNEIYIYDATIKGTISSPGYGKQHYLNNLSCKYQINTPNGYRIKITFKDLDIYPSSSCKHANLTITSKYSTVKLFAFCGSNLPNPFFSREKESAISIFFNTGFVGAGRGFSLEYEASPYFTSVCNGSYLQCENRNCYTYTQKCNGIDDCGDGTDEEDCGYPVNNLPNKDECGFQEILPNIMLDSDRMFGGNETVPHSWPWQVSLRFKENTSLNRHFCGGTLINAQWVLTATHCIAGFFFMDYIQINVGSHNIFQKSQYEQIRKAKKLFTYPNNKGIILNYSDDISLIKLNAPVTFNKGVQPACLPSQNFKAEPGWNCIVTGWGKTKGTGFAGSLKQMEMTLQPRSKCIFDRRIEICVSRNGNSPCEGDGGGPINCKLGNKWYVLGSASRGTTSNLMESLCAGHNAQTIYYSAASKADWIKTIVKENS